MHAPCTLFPFYGIFVHQVTIGSRVLAHDGEAWYRAQVSSILPGGGEAKVFLLDLATYLTVDIASLKVASPDLFDLPVMAVPACLSGWEGEDPVRMAEEWGEKMKVLAPDEQFTKVLVELVEQNINGSWKVKVPAWEKDLVRKSGSETGHLKGKAASLMMKMKSSSK